MKLVITVVNHDDTRSLLDRLGRAGFGATVMNATGGHLHVSRSTIMCGVDDEEVDEVLAIIREICVSRVQYVTPLPPVMEPGEMHIPTPVEKNVGGATVFVVPVDHYEKM